jgi:hypothetical protein
MENNKALTPTSDTAVIEYGKNSGKLTRLIAEELKGLNLTFERIRIPAGGGLAFEVPSDNPDSPDTVKEFRAVILHQHDVHVYYRDKYTGGNTPPDCASNDGEIGRTHDGEIKTCNGCPLNSFNTAAEGEGKACKQKRELYILRAGESLPIIITLPNGSLAEFTRYITRLASKDKAPKDVVTKFSLRKAQNKSGIIFSQAVLTLDRDLTPAEAAVIDPFAEQIKALANRVPNSVVEGEDEE